MRVAVIHGPNLNLLGTRQPEVYGSLTLSELEDQVAGWASKMGIEPAFHQSNDESELVELIQGSAGLGGIVLNAGGFTHTSVAVADAVASVPAPVVEVHISDIHRREKFRHTSLIAPNAVLQIVGRGAVGYRDALRHLVNRSGAGYETLAYGPHPLNVADHRVAPASRALVVLVHGGFWRPVWGRDQMESLAVDLFGRGYDTLNIAYRTEPPWPGSGHDIATARAFARGLHDRVVLLGHSVGGYLSLWAQRRDPADLCVALAPVTDLELCREFAEVETALAAGGPSQVGLPENTAVFHGADDAEVPVEHSKRLDGESVNILAGEGHFGVLDPQRPHWESVVGAIDAAMGN